MNAKIEEILGRLMDSVEACEAVQKHVRNYRDGKLVDCNLRDIGLAVEELRAAQAEAKAQEAERVANLPQIESYEIKPEELYWASFNHFEFRLPGQCVLDCSHSGECMDDVKEWAPKVREIMEKDNFPLKPTPEKIRKELKEYGSWDDEELANDEENWVRIVWVAANDVMESSTPDCSEPLK